MKRKQLVDFLTDYWGRDFLAKWRVKDEYMVNGLQVVGTQEVKKVALGVSVNVDFLNHALHQGADTCIFHHGLNFYFPHQTMPMYLRKRLELVLKNSLNIFGFHGAMDAHPTRGHNILILKKLGAKKLGPIFDDWGYYGDLEKPVRLAEIGQQCRDFFDHEIFVVGEPDKKVKRIGVVSGGASPARDELADLIEKGVELYISGEIKESRPHIFSESGLAYFACGHYATEKVGVLALQKALQKEFPKLGVEFIDINNPL